MSCRVAMDTVMVTALCGVLVMSSCVHCELTAKFISQSPAHLLLTCSTRNMAHGADVISIRLQNGTDTLAWLAKDGAPKLGNGSKRMDDHFVSGKLHKGDLLGSKLQLLVLNHQTTQTATYKCVISLLGVEGTISHRDFVEAVKVPQPDHTTETGKVSTGKPSPTTKPIDSGIRTGSSVLQPTVLSAGIPMPVLIVLLVLITLLLVVTSALLLQKFRGRCCSSPAPYPSSHYALSGEGYPAWEGIKGGDPGLHRLPLGLRSHYSLPRPLHPPPPPPPPKLQRSKSSVSSDYAGVPNGLGRSYHYTTPYDAIVQREEDGELSLLNTSAHMDVTPALPPEPAGIEAAYKIPRVEAEAQTQGQGHSMFVALPLKDSSFDLE